MSNAEAAVEPRNEYVDFWNTILVPKFVRWRHIIVDGLTLAQREDISFARGA